MDEAALHDWLRKSLSIRAIPKEVWQDLEAQGFIKDALDPDYRNGKAALKKEAERLLRFMHLGAARPSPPGRSRQKEYKPFLSQGESARAEAFSIYLARQAATTGLVRRFRAEILHDRILSQQQVLAWLRSPATRFLPIETFAYYAIPMVDHKAFEVSPPKQGWSTPPGHLFRIEEVTLRITWAGGVFEERLEYPLFPRTQLYFPTADGHGFQRVIAWPCSVLDTVDKISKQLTQWYFWSAADASMFLLTDATPLIAPLQVSIRGLSRDVNDAFPEVGDDPEVFKNASWPLSLYRRQITLTIEAWVSDDTVLRAYQAAQRQVLKRDNRPRGKRILALVRFLAELENVEKMTWDERMTAWNRAQIIPLWQYDDMTHVVYR